MKGELGDTPTLALLGTMGRRWVAGSDEEVLNTVGRVVDVWGWLLMCRDEKWSEGRT